MIKLKNPLTLEERISLSKLHDHNFAAETGFLKERMKKIMEGEIGFQENKEKLYVLASIEHSCLRLIHTYQQDDILFLVFPISSSFIRKNISDIPLFIYGDMCDCLDIDLKSNVDEFQDLYTDHKAILFSMINLVKNSMYKTNTKILTDISSVEVSEEQTDSFVYAAVDSVPSGEFLRLSVNDDGKKGFDKSRPLREYLELGVTTKQSGTGFGLNFCKSMAKCHKGYVDIVSQPGDTTVSVYFPAWR